MNAVDLGDAGPLTGLRIAQARMAAGPWLAEIVGPVRFDRRTAFDVLVGIYLITDPLGRLVYLGQARREGGVAARLDGHRREADKRSCFEHVHVLALHDRTDQPTINAIEGRTADVLGVRGRLGTGYRSRRWPAADRWTELVSCAAARERAAVALGGRSPPSFGRLHRRIIDLHRVEGQCDEVRESGHVKRMK